MLHFRAAAASRPTLLRALAATRGAPLAQARHCSQGATAVQPSSVVVEVPVDAAGEEPKLSDDDILKPKEIMKELNRYIVGQDDAKKAVAVAMPSRPETGISISRSLTMGTSLIWLLYLGSSTDPNVINAHRPRSKSTSHSSNEAKVTLVKLPWPLNSGVRW